MFRKNEMGNSKFGQLQFLITLKIIAENQPIRRRRLLKGYSTTIKGGSFLKANLPDVSKVNVETLTPCKEFYTKRKSSTSEFFDLSGGHQSTIREAESAFDLRENEVEAKGCRATISKATEGTSWR